MHRVCFRGVKSSDKGVQRGEFESCISTPLLHASLYNARIVNFTGDAVVAFGENTCGDLPLWLYNEVSSLRLF